MPSARGTSAGSFSSKVNSYLAGPCARYEWDWMGGIEGQAQVPTSTFFGRGCLQVPVAVVFWGVYFCDLNVIWSSRMAHENELSHSLHSAAYPPSPFGAPKKRLGLEIAASTNRSKTATTSWSLGWNFLCGVGLKGRIVPTINFPPTGEIVESNYLGNSGVGFPNPKPHLGLFSRQFWLRLFPRARDDRKLMI